MHEMEGFKGKWLQISAELYDEFLKVFKAILKLPCPIQYWKKVTSKPDEEFQSIFTAFLARLKWFFFPVLKMGWACKNTPVIGRNHLISIKLEPVSQSPFFRRWMWVGCWGRQRRCQKIIWPSFFLSIFHTSRSSNNVHSTNKELICQNDGWKGL